MINFSSFLLIGLISFIWLIVFTKKLLFWVYLWQLKEYHLGRFVDHFRTQKGKRLILNEISVIELILILFPFLYSFFFSSPQFLHFLLWYFSIVLIFIFQTIKTLYDIRKKNLKVPVLTKKTVLILSLGFFLEGGILAFFLSSYYWIWAITLMPFLLLDFFSPLIFSALVLIIEPFAILGRWQLIEKAKKRRLQFKKLLVVGITGSYGKTSTKEFLSVILSEKFRVLKTKEHQNSEVGISQCILNELNENHQIFIAEMGAYNRGGIKLLSEIIQPRIGILTGINEQHMATFGSQKNITKTKFELIESLKEDGTAILNGDNEFIKLGIKTPDIKVKKQKFYSVNKKLDIWAEDIKEEKNSISFRVFSKDRDSSEFKLNLLGIQNIPNLLAAVCCAKELGMELEEISKACEKIKPKQGGVKLFKNKKGLNIIDATYSANPNGVISHLDYLKNWTGKKIIIMPCLIELGKVSEEIHQKIGEKIGKVCDLAIITTKERFEEIKEAALKSGLKEENILFMENSKEIYEKLMVFSKPDDVVLLESRVPKQLINLLLE